MSNDDAITMPIN